MDLFNPQSCNLLPRDGEAIYFGPLCTANEADELFAALMEEIDWQHDRVKLYGREIVTKREVAWHGDAAFQYTYSHNTKTALPWTPTLQNIKQMVEAESGDSFNCCLLNLYHSGEEGMAWHADDEKELLPDGAIASVSLGAPRRFVFRHKADKEKAEILLAHGSLLLMRGTTQSHWEHSLPVMKRANGARINLTFRTIVG
jgi:alkylated DNA repair dioxygenase AlkB